MFQQMRDAVLVGAFVAAAATDPNAELHGVQVRHGIGDDDEAGGQARYLDAHAARL